MNSQRAGENRQEEHHRLGASTARQANADELLSELKRLLESSGRPPFAPQPPSPSAPIVSTSPSTAAETQRSTDFAKAHDGADDLRADGPAVLRDTYGQHRHPTREASHLRSRRWRLAASGLAVGFAALAGANLALKPAAPGSKSPSSVVPMQAQSNAQPPSAEPVVAASSDVGRSLMKDSGLSDQMQFGRTEAGINAQESPPKTSAAIDAQRPAEGPNALPVATTAETPASAGGAAGSALTASQTAGVEPVRSVVVTPDGSPIARMFTNSVDSTSPGETPTPHTEAASTASIKVELCKATGHEDRIVSDAQCQQKVRKKICCKGREGHSGSNGRGSETDAFSGAASEDGDITNRSGGHRSSSCRAN